MQSTIEELETSNEEFKAANEEVTSVNEELQSTNEELETSKEELQSLNEEMQTVNHQLEQKVAELESTNNDLDNLLSITEVATILLDRELRIKRFTQRHHKAVSRDRIRHRPADQRSRQVVHGRRVVVRCAARAREPDSSHEGDSETITAAAT